MASASAPVDEMNLGNSQKSRFQKTVCLEDWWLVKDENGALAVAGITSRENRKQAVRVFSSAPIVDTYSEVSLETSDGICVVLDGLINKDRTIGNGFPSIMCDYFIFGFPLFWKEYHDKFMANESSSKNISGNPLKKKKISPHSENSHEKDFESQGKMNPKESKGVLTRSAVKNQTDQIVAGTNSLSEKAKVDSHEKDFESQGKMNPKESKGVLTRSAVKNQTDQIVAGTNSLSEKAKVVGVETQSKSVHASMETPDGKEKRVPSASPESFKRSRSGRLLMPSLEFWRNQRPVYDGDGSITEIEGAINEEPIIASCSEDDREIKNQNKRGKAGAKPSSSKESNPLYFEIILKSNRSRLSLGKGFTTAAGLMGKETVEVVGKQYGRWIKLNHTGGRTEMGAGWPEFQRKNALEYEKTYSFEFKPSENAIHVKEVNERN